MGFLSTFYIDLNYTDNLKDYDPNLARVMLTMAQIAYHEAQCDKPMDRLRAIFEAQYPVHYAEPEIHDDILTAIRAVDVSHRDCRPYLEIPPQTACLITNNDRSAQIGKLKTLGADLSVALPEMDHGLADRQYWQAGEFSDEAIEALDRMEGAQMMDFAAVNRCASAMFIRFERGVPMRTTSVAHAKNDGIGSAPR